MRARRLLPAVLSAVLGLLATRALADGDREERARTLAQEGLDAFERKDYPAAIASFEQAYALKAAPRLLFNIAQAYRLSDSCARALKYYRDYLKADPKTEIAREVKRRIHQMEACAERQERPPYQPPPGPTSAPVGTPLPAATPAPAPAPVAALAPETTGGGGQKRLAGIITGCGGLLLVGTSGWFGVRARHAADQVDARFREGGDWTQADRDLEARGKRDQTVAIVLGATGGVAVAAGVFLYLWGAREDVALALLPGGGALTWSASF